MSLKNMYISNRCLKGISVGILALWQMFLNPVRMHVVTLTANVRFKMENEQIKTLQKQFLWLKLEWKYYFLVEAIEEKKRETMVTWYKLTFAAKSL